LFVNINFSAGKSILQFCKTLLAKFKVLLLTNGDFKHILLIENGNDVAEVISVASLPFFYPKKKGSNGNEYSF